MHIITVTYHINIAMLTSSTLSVTVNETLLVTLTRKKTRLTMLSVTLELNKITLFTLERC